MRKLILVCALLPCIVALAGCPKKGGDADAGDDGAAAAAAALAAAADATPADAGAVAPVAKNAADVARFPAGEKAVADDDQKILAPFAQARTAPHGGAIVATVKVGTDPFKIAEFQDAVLIVFPDPKDVTTSVMGWVAKSAFVGAVVVDAGIHDASTDVAVVPVVPGLLKCAAGQEAIINLTSAPVCRRKCTTDKDCKVTTPGSCAAGSTLAGKITKVCANEAP